MTPPHLGEVKRLSLEFNKYIKATKANGAIQG